MTVGGPLMAAGATDDGHPRIGSVPCFFATPRTWRNLLSTGLCLIFPALAILFCGFFAVVPERYPGQLKGLGWGYLIAAGLGVLGLIGAWIAWGFSITFSREGIARRGRFSAGPSLEWKDLGRIDFFVQQRRMGLGGCPSNLGVASQRIAGFRFRGRDGGVILCSPDDFRYANSRDVVAGVYNGVVAPAIRQVAADGKTVLARVRAGTAAQEDGFGGRLQQEIRDVRDLEFRGEVLIIVDAGGQATEVAFGGRGAASDLTGVELIWDRTLEEE